MTRQTDPQDLTGADLARWLFAAALVLGGGSVGLLALNALPPTSISGVGEVTSFEVVFETAELAQKEALDSLAEELVENTPVTEPVPAEAETETETETETEAEVEPEQPLEPEIQPPDEQIAEPEAEAEAEAEVQLESEPQPEVVPQIEPMPEPEPQEAPEPEPEPIEKTEPEPEPEPEQLETAEAIPEEIATQPRVTAPVPLTRPAHLTAPQPRAAAPAPRAAAPTASAPRQAPSAQVAAQAASQAAAPSAAQEATWQNRLVAHLNRKKTYPREAQRARLTGTVVMRFTLDANGGLVSASIAQSSGVPALDEAAAALVRRASPYPTPPAGIGAGKLTLRVPIAYDLAR